MKSLTSPFTPFKDIKMANTARSMKSGLISFLLAISLVFNLAFVVNSLKLQEQVVQLQTENTRLKAELGSCGMNGVKKMANEYVIDPVMHAYQAVKAKVMN